MKNFTIKSSDLVAILGAIALDLALTGGINGFITPGEMMLCTLKGAFFIIAGLTMESNEKSKKH